MAKTNWINFAPVQGCRSIQLTFLIVTILFSYASSSCPPLTVLPGAVLSCQLPPDNRTIDCLGTDSVIPKGTVGNYKCEGGNFSETFVKCKCKGKWGGIRVFNDFMSACNMSNYTIDGPPELNLTEKEIHDLSTSVVNFTAKDFQEDGTAYHNLYRKLHHSPTLKLNKTLCDAAQKWAEQEVESKFLKVEDWANRWYSQNMYRFTGSSVDASEAVRLAVAAWYQGAYRYDWENPSASGQSAFTQVVWKSTSDLGIGVAQKGNHTLVVADYWPPGNVVVENPDLDRWAWFKENVLPPNNINNDTSSTIAATTPTPTTTTVATTPTQATTVSSVTSILSTTEAARL